ncbi:MAG: hypothetical protein GX591_09275 [Planctomycetes bacterium]|nr:hypothetical protein [Planctomycetota bacterium]
MNRARSAGMWGLDIADRRLRLIRIVREGRQARLARAVSIAVADDATDAELADLLRRSVLGSGDEGDQVAVCLPATAGYVRAGRADEPSAAPHAAVGDAFIADTWSVGGDDGQVVHAAADRRQVQRLIGIVQQAHLRASHVALAQLATAAAAGLLETARGPSAVVAVDHAQVRFVLARHGLPVVCRSSPRDPKVPADQDVAARAVGLCRAARMNDPGAWPGDLAVVADDESWAALQGAASALGASIRRVEPGRWAGLTAAGVDRADISEYAVPIGAALMAMGLTGRRMDFRGLLAHPAEPQPLVRRRFWAALAATLVLAAAATFTMEWGRKQAALRDLQARWDDLQPRLQRATQVKADWDRLRPWLSGDLDGGRIGQLGILSDIASAFPDASEAYVSEMTVDAGRDGAAVEVALRGRAVSSEIVHECIARLNDSARLAAQLGPVSDVEQAVTYPKGYQIPITIEAPGDGRDAP